MKADSGQYQGILINIKYARTGSLSVFKNGNKVTPLGFAPGGNGAIGVAPMLTVTGQTDGCGENNFQGGAENRLSFFLAPNHNDACVVTISPRNAIMLGIRLEFTLDQFFEKGGVSTFANRLAAVLGIHYADIKVVSVYQPNSRRQL